MVSLEISVRRVIERHVRLDDDTLNCSHIFMTKKMEIVGYSQKGCSKGNYCWVVSCEFETENGSEDYQLRVITSDAVTLRIEQKGETKMRWLVKRKVKDVLLL